MGYEKFTWVIKNFSSLGSEVNHSDYFVIGSCKWFLMTYPKGFQNSKYLSLYLVVEEPYNTLPCGSKRRTKYRLSVINQLSDKLSQRQEGEKWFYRNYDDGGFHDMLLLTKLNDKNGGFLVNNEVKIVAEVEVFEGIGELDVVSEESQVVTQPSKRIKLNGDLQQETSLVDVNGFQVLPSQAESVKRIFERHPDMALEFRAKNQHLRTSCINVLLSLIKTLCQSLEDISIDDLGQAEQALTYLEYSYFKLDWLELKLEEVKEKKMEEQIGKTRVHESEEELKVFKQKCSDKEALLKKEKEELKDLKQKCSDAKALLKKDKEELKDLKQKCSDTEALLEKEKAKVLATSRAPPLTLDDVV